MSTHAFKKVAPAPRQGISFVRLVTQWGDGWRCMVPGTYINVGFEDDTHDTRDATRMKLMEKGILPRVESV